MKKIIVVLIIGFTFGIAQAGEIPTKGSLNTLVLSSGDVVYDLSGEWEAVYDHDRYGTDRGALKISQEGDRILGVKLTDSLWVPKGCETLKGKLGKGYVTLLSSNVGDGWINATTEIADHGNKIIVTPMVGSRIFSSMLILTRR